MPTTHAPTRLASFVFAAAAIALWACGDQRAPTAPQHGDATIRGTVTSEKTSAGVSGLVVALLRDDTVVRATPTDSSGAFEFPDLARGNYAVRLTGFDLANVDLRSTAFTPDSANVSVAGDPVNVLFAAVGLVAPHIVGTVQCGGVPVADAQVRVIGGDTDVTVTTNAQGKYGATDLAAGHYAVIVVAAPCTVAPPFAAATLKAGQAAQVDFQG